MHLILHCLRLLEILIYIFDDCTHVLYGIFLICPLNICYWLFCTWDQRGLVPCQFTLDETHKQQCIYWQINLSCMSSEIVLGMEWNRIE